MKILNCVIPSYMTLLGRQLLLVYIGRHSIINGMELKSTKSEMFSTGITLTHDFKKIN